jgi:hypothetical protein
MPESFSLPREVVRSYLQIPSPFLVTQGYSAAVLDALDVGHSDKRRTTVVPVYDHTGDVCVGFCDRSERPKCPECKLHHFRGDCRFGSRPWLFQEGFKKSNHLYAYARALKSDRPFVLLVPGPDHVWRAIEAALDAVACFGDWLSQEQVRLLARLDKNVVIAFGDDQRAASVAEALDTLGVIHQVLKLPSSYKNIAEMQPDQLRDLVAECPTV